MEDFFFIVLCSFVKMCKNLLSGRPDACFDWDSVHVFSGRPEEHKIILYSLEADMLFFEKNAPEVLACLDSEKTIEQNAFR